MKTLPIRLDMLIRYQSVPEQRDRRTDTQNCHIYIVRCIELTQMRNKNKKKLEMNTSVTVFQQI